MQRIPISLTTIAAVLAIVAPAAAEDEYVPSCGFDKHSASKELKGLKLNQAREAASSMACTLRVVKKDGKDLPVTKDLRPDRINVAVKDKRVKKVVGLY